MVCNLEAGLYLFSGNTIHVIILIISILWHTFMQLQAASQSQALVLMGDFNHPDIS